MTSKSHSALKYFDIVAAALLVIGGLNWGLVGFFGYDLVANIFGHMSMFSKVIYVLVGLAAIYQGLQFKSIARRWDCSWAYKEAHGSPT